MPGDDTMNDLPGSPDDPASPAETAQAESFARLVDELMAGSSLPPALASDERALVEVAAIMRVCVGEPRDVELDASRRDALIDQALLQALEHKVGQGRDQAMDQAMDQHGRERSEVENDEREHGAAVRSGAQEGLADSDAGRPEHVPGDVPGDGPGDVMGARRRRRLGTIIPWALTAAAVAAALFLALQRPAPEHTASLPEPASRSEIHRSRPADALIGQIPRDRAERASDRLDMIYADRMAGYRDLRLRGGHQ
jgi:hypothetical protein